MSFQELDAMTAEHRKAVGFIRPAANARAGLLTERLRPLDRIRPVLERRYLVKGWMDRGAFSVVYGESNVGKTFLALDMALHIAAGADWHGSRIHEPQQVVYVAAEGGTGLNNRIAAYRRDQKDLTDAAAPNFMVLAEGLDLCTGEDAQYLAEALNNADVRPALIVIDTLARVMGNGDENTAKDMGQLVRSVDRLRAETGAHVMVIHHSGKDASKGARGSGSLRAAADTEIELTRNDDVVMAEARKQRDMPCDGVFAYRLKSVFIGQDEDGDSVSSAVVAETDIQKADKRTKLSGRAQVALDALKEVIRDKGQIVKSEDLPAVPVVSLSDWQAACDRVGLTDSEKSDTKARIFRRHRDTLMDKNRIRIWDNYVWLADKADRQRTTPDKSAPDPDGHGHPPIRGVPCPVRDELSAPSQTNDPIPEAFRPPVDPDAYDPEMWK
ncbi:AAA family ATPase [Paracoccus aurantiacus]|uniref:AAA family ATPase n=1 Tax=Paracoccus aurantiacus TaxID=2599412 RepID=A0A5C6S629_9RHOB|nr:helicase RepA family protein [Paracoccus aurantiacus]TXB69757.1 AAA family ATPase [Paracoccus aurantiacus]